MSYKFPIYIDLTTTGLATDPYVIGSVNNFTVTIPPLNLPNDEDYLVSLVDFRYVNVDLSPSVVYPIVQCSIAMPIIVNGKLGSILYKSSTLANNTLAISESPANTYQISVPVINPTISTIQISIVRSDNGQAFPLNSATNVAVILEISRASRLTN